jgi:BlaI family penicillinase repressor
VKASIRPSDVELQVLTVLWRDGALTARQVSERLPDRKKRAYTTVLSTMQVMEKKGLLHRTRQGVTHLYRPAVKQKRVLRPLLQGLINKLFGGSPAAALQYLLRDAEPDREEMAKIRSILDEHDRGKDGSKRGKTS